MQGYEEVFVKIDGFDEAILGIGEKCGVVDVLVYDKEKCIEILQRDGVSEDDAREYFEFNVSGLGLGEGTPIFMIWNSDSE